VIVPVRLTGAQRRAPVISDNRPAMNAPRAEDLLRAGLQALQEESFDLERLRAAAPVQTDPVAGDGRQECLPARAAIC
jgi:hypothetical protein